MNSNVPAAVLALALLAGACSRTEPAAAAANAASSATAAEKRYPLRGEIVSVDTARKILVVKHEAIEGYMPGMTMEFDVSAGDIAVAKAGQRIRAEMIPSETANFRLEKIWPDDKVATDTVAAVSNALRQDTHNRGKEAYREIGETIPDFALYDQDGRVVQSTRFRGKQIMLNFIYSRCPVATMCPAATAKMMQLQKSAREAGVKDLELVSITLEPSYDTPGVLKEYATVRGIDTSNFSFLTGPQNAIDDLLTQFGVIAEFKGGVVQHSLATLLIADNGKIAHRVDGSTWDPAEFLARMKK
jgi:protein SCO1/2